MDIKILGYLIELGKIGICNVVVERYSTDSSGVKSFRDLIGLGREHTNYVYWG